MAIHTQAAKKVHALKKTKSQSKSNIKLCSEINSTADWLHVSVKGIN